MSSDPFTPMPLFSFPVFSAMIGEADQHRAGLVEAILDLRSRFPGVRKSNRNGWHSGDEFLAQNDPHVTWLMQAVGTYARKALGRYYQEWNGYEMRLGKCWANVLDKGGWNAPHHHFPTHWSGSYYVSVGEVGTDAEDMQGMIEFLNPTPWQSAWNRSGNFALSPKDGQTLLFPASIYHFVHPYAGERPRISVAYNFNVVPKGS